MRRLRMLRASISVFKGVVKEALEWDTLSRTQKFIWFWGIIFIITPMFIDALLDGRIPLKEVK